MKAKTNSKNRSGLQTIMLPSLPFQLIVLPMAVLRDFMGWFIAARRKLGSSYLMSPFLIQLITVRLFTIELISNAK